MKPNLALVSDGLKYWFLKNEQLHLSQQSILDRKSDLFWVFDEAINNVISLSERYKKEIWLALSSWVDSAIIYQLLKKRGANFKAINIGFWSAYSEAERIKETLWEKNISFIDESAHNWLQITNSIDFHYFVTHPTIKAYYFLLKNIPDNSILLTWDLSDDCFRIQESYRKGDLVRARVFEDSEIQAMTNQNITSEIHYRFRNIIEEEFFFFENITLKSIENLIGSLGKNWIIYYPFYQHFIPYSEQITDEWYRSQNKSFIVDYARILGLDYSANYKTIWFKYGKNIETVNSYFDYVVKNKWYLASFGIHLSEDMLFLLKNDLLKNRWKIFTLVVFITLAKKNDFRFFSHPA